MPSAFDVESVVFDPGHVSVVQASGEIDRVQGGASPAVFAVDRRAPWRVVKELYVTEKNRGGVIFLVNFNGQVRGLSLEEEIVQPALWLSAESNGAMCLSPPGTDDKGCLGAMDRRVSRAGAVDIAKRSVEKYGVTSFEVTVHDGVNFGDVVRLLDSARSCCDKGTFATLDLIR